MKKEGFEWKDAKGKEVPKMEETELGTNGEAGFLWNRQGIRLATYHWPVGSAPSKESTRGVVVLVHGYAVHVTYTFFQSESIDPPKPYEGSWVHRLNQKGYGVWGLDNQSCGRSDGVRDGIRMFFERFEDLCNDVEQLCLLVKNHPDYKDCPLFLMGSSMGGNIAMHVSQTLYERGLLQGTILLSPMIAVDSMKSSTMRRMLFPMARVLSYFLPSMEAVASRKRVRKHPFLHRQYEMDPLNFHGDTRMLVAVLSVQQCEKTMMMLDRFEFPFFVLHSEHDDICDPCGSDLLFERSPSKDKEMSKLSDPESYHMLSIEPMHLKLLDEITEWIGKRSRMNHGQEPG